MAPYGCAGGFTQPPVAGSTPAGVKKTKDGKTMETAKEKVALNNMTLERTAELMLSGDYRERMAA